MITAEVSDDESLALTDVIVSFCLVALRVAKHYPHCAKNIVAENFSLIFDLAQLAWWDSDTGPSSNFNLRQNLGLKWALFFCQR